MGMRDNGMMNEQKHCEQQVVYILGIYNWNIGQEKTELWKQT
jgi:hypothetical protein